MYFLFVFDLNYLFFLSFLFLLCFPIVSFICTRIIRFSIVRKKSHGKLKEKKLIQKSGTAFCFLLKMSCDWFECMPQFFQFLFFSALSYLSLSLHEAMVSILISFAGRTKGFYNSLLISFLAKVVGATTEPESIKTVSLLLSFSTSMLQPMQRKNIFGFG